MSLKPRTLILLALVASLLLGGVLWLDRSGRDGAALDGGPVLPGLEARLNALDTVRIVGAGDEVLVTLARGDSGWSVNQRDGWPADVDQLRQSLLKLAQAQRREPKTAKPENHARLGVESVASADAKGVRMELEGGGEPLAVIVGQNNPQGRGSFVRLPDEPQSWLADADLAVARAASRWLARDLFDVSPRRIATVEVRPATGKPVRIERRPDADPDLELLDVPRGRKVNGGYLIESTVGLFDNLQLEDVRKAPEDMPAPTVTAEYRAADGLVIALRGWLEGETLWVDFAPSLDGVRARAFAEAEAEKDRKAAQAATQPAEGEGETKTPPDEELAPLLKDAATRVAERRAEVEAIRQKAAGWQFALPSFKAAHLRRSHDDYLLSAD